MKFGSLLFALCCTQSLAATINTNRKLSQNEIMDALLASPHIMPRKVYDKLVAEYGQKKLRRRQTKTDNKTPSMLDQLKDFWDIVQQIPNDIMNLSTAPNKEDRPKSTVAEVQKSKSPLYPGATRVKVRSGPFRMQPTSEKNVDWWLWNMEGAAQHIRYGITKPCNQCMILRVESDIEYFDGSHANITKDAMFHHTMLFNTGADVREPTCGQPYIENLFMSGNERTPTNYSLVGAGLKSGYVVRPNDDFMSLTNLQNFANKEQYVWQTFTYDIVEDRPPEYLPAQIVWFTIGTLENPSLGLCHWANGEFPWGETNLTNKDLPKSRVFSEHSKIWTSDKTGLILATGGHVHPGATSLEIWDNGKMICDSVATYGAPGGEHGHAPMKKRQIPAGGNYTNLDVPFVASMHFCEYPQGLEMKPGDKIFISTNYDLNKHKGVINAEGQLDQVMGMAGTLVAFKS